MDTEFVKKRILTHIIQAELATYESCYAPDGAVIPISWLLEWEPEVTKCWKERIARDGGRYCQQYEIIDSEGEDGLQ